MSKLRLQICLDIEDFFNVTDRLGPLHYEEVCGNSNPAVGKGVLWKEQYRELWKQGIHRAFFISHDGDVVGYISIFIHPHLHYANILCAFEDMHFIKKEFRRGWEVLRVYQKLCRYCKSQGCEKIFFHDLQKRNLNVFFRRLANGECHSHNVYNWWL